MYSLRTQESTCWDIIEYAKLADIEQGEKETPGKFPDRLREALCKFTDIAPKSAKEE